MDSKQIRPFLEIVICSVALLMLFSCKPNLTIKESFFSKSLVPGKFILPAEEGWWNWGMSPIYDENGKLHVFMSTIPNKGRWIKDSKIVHFTADKPEGPYQFIDTTFSSKSSTYHNPQVSKVGDTYVMVYLVKERTTPRLAQQIGIATTKSLDEPWIESPHNPIIKASGKMNGANIIHASNPTFLVDENGKYRIYYKSVTDNHKDFREISLAIGDNLEGPYENYQENPLISYADMDLDIEDPYAFYYKGMYYLIVEDRMNVKSALEGNPKTLGKKELGGKRPGLIYKSKDGIHWDRPEIGYNTNSHYFNHELARSERPNILWENGKPAYLFLACHDEDPTAGYFLKIENWK
ncbi:glycoside hydrolase family protein [Polaribacter sp. Asnod6-C07]|uniref:glycoside hydrolase family protein n=1 Tax=Polaribacter sp. Asnod6-C07 TaxID=3160582 RepID=UPI0038650F1C